MSKKHLLTFLILLNSCSFGPEYKQPEIQIPASFNAGSERTSVSDSVVTSWWKTFEDPELNKIVESALQNNHDLAATIYKVEQSYARLGSVRSELYPQLEASGLFRREQISEQTLTPFTLPPHNLFQGAFALSWELDLWGRVRKSVESSISEITAQEYLLKGLRISLASSVISAYVQLRELDSMYAITQETVKSRREYLSLIKSKYKAEAVQELDLRQAESEVLVAETELPRIERLIGIQENLINYLQGLPSTKVNRGTLRPVEGDRLKIPANIPSSLLQTRPDIAEADAKLKSAYAQVGVALAEYFPRIALTGSYGRASAEFDDFFSSAAKTWSYGPSLSLPIFNAGRISSNVDFSEAKLKELEATYRNTWYKSLKEVNDALISIEKTQQISELLSKQVKVLSRYLLLSRTRYEQGQTSYLEVLDAERRLFLAQLELTRIQSNNIQSKIDFMKSIGGDWF